MDSSSNSEKPDSENKVHCQAIVLVQQYMVNFIFSKKWTKTLRRRKHFYYINKTFTCQPENRKTNEEERNKAIVAVLADRSV
jgi:hypothetical protein